jgi:hypothetical protein
MASIDNHSKCNRCKVSHDISHYERKRNGVLLKSCNRCRTKQLETRIRNKCEHKRNRSLCKDCGGASICEHNRVRSVCKDCGGSQICEHNRRRSVCKDCAGSQICEHDRIRNLCKDCGGASICEHNRVRNMCKECGGSRICEHNRERSKCKECSSNPIKLTLKNMINRSRKSDKKYNRYDANNFIDMCFLEGLVEDTISCYYCSCQFQWIKYQDNLATIERLDNSVGHIKSNCVFACKRCNNNQVGQQ